jgi:hypothetical protein
MLVLGQERYMERDTMDMQEVTKSVSDLLRPFYAQVWLPPPYYPLQPLPIMQ